MSARPSQRGPTNITNKALPSVPENESAPVSRAISPEARHSSIRSLRIAMLQYTFCTLTILVAFGTLIAGLAAEKEDHWQKFFIAYICRVESLHTS